MFPLEDPAGGARTLDRLASFRVTYVAIFVFVLLFIFTLDAAEFLLDGRFRRLVTEAARVERAQGPVVLQVQEQVNRLLREDPWIVLGGVRVTPIVLGADGWTPLYVGGPVPLPADLDPLGPLGRADELLPASVDVVVSVPLNTVLASVILVGYGALLMQFLFLYNRSVARREEARLEEAMASRDATAIRTDQIQHELDLVRGRLSQVEPLEESRTEEVRALEAERAALQEKLATLERRERELRGHASQSEHLDEERRALEELLEEAVQDLETRDQEIRSLQTRLKKAAKATPTGGRGRETEQLARRLRTLYKNLEIDDRAVADLIGLRDEAMKLKAEENLKRLSDEADNAAIRRKVGGLPPHLSIFELGFGGKGRIYYTRGQQRRFRVLAVGAKNTQKTDLEYLSRLK